MPAGHREVVGPFLNAVTLLSAVPPHCYTPEGITSTSGPETITFTGSSHEDRQLGNSYTQ